MTQITYTSTRAGKSGVSFAEAVLAGVDSDGGLYLPENLPIFDAKSLAELATLDYVNLCYCIVKPFVSNAINDSDLLQIITKSYQKFRHQAIAPLTQIKQNVFVLELFHGPTYAFKDFALQFLGQLASHLIDPNKPTTIIGATSGDTGAAALEGFVHQQSIQQFILFPHYKVSEIQRRQMTTRLESHIHCIAIEGDFDDCQRIVKYCLNNKVAQQRFISVNSINWARILAQIVYYFYAATKLGAPAKAVNFVVPTGNFGNVLSAHYARAMGLPINSLSVATNSNDILHRTIANNDYTIQDLIMTHAPSMDIVVSSNFERLVFELLKGDSEQVKELMQQLANSGRLQLPDSAWKQLKQLFQSHRVGKATTIDTIQQYYQNSQYLLDPHSAIAVKAAEQLAPHIPTIALATAHPSKFAETIQALANIESEQLHQLDDLLNKKERFQTLPADHNVVQQYILEHGG